MKGVQLVLTPVADDPRHRLGRAMAGAFAGDVDPVAMIRELRDEWDG